MPIRRPLTPLFLYFQYTQDVTGQYYLYFADAQQKWAKIKP